MKKLLFGAMVGVALLGAGCSKVTETPPAEVATAPDGTVVPPAEAVEGAWFLAFSLPEGWVMAPSYDEDVAQVPSSDSISTAMTDIVVQDTNKVVILTGETELAEGTYVDSDYTYIRVFRMGKRSVVPEEADDMGNGFWKLEQGVQLTYYFQAEGATYKFVVYQDGQDQAATEQVITSAKEVTDFTQVQE